MQVTDTSKHKTRKPKERRSYTRKVNLLGVLAIAMIVSTPAWAQDEHSRDFDETFTVDVALDSATLVVNHVDPSQSATAQNRGDTLVIDGTIYRGGSLRGWESAFRNSQ